jgi:hypothetical protein
MVDAISSMFHDRRCKYSPFVLPLFVGVQMEVNEGPEFIIGPTNGGSKYTKMDVGRDGEADPGIEFEINGVTGLLVPSMRLCRHFKTLRMACPSVDFKCTNIFSSYKTTMSNPSSFDVPIFNSCDVPHNLSFKVSS